VEGIVKVGEYYLFANTWFIAGRLMEIVNGIAAVSEAVTIYDNCAYRARKDGFSRVMLGEEPKEWSHVEGGIAYAGVMGSTIYPLVSMIWSKGGHR